MDDNAAPEAKLPTTCPSCQQGLVVTRLACPDCTTEVSGRFPLPEGGEIGPEDRDFVLMFVKTKGNLKRMERESGTSYWTIRRKLDQIAGNLEVAPGTKSGAAEQTNAEARAAILKRLREGQLEVEEADRLLQALGRQDTKTFRLERFDIKAANG